MVDFGTFQNICTVGKKIYDIIQSIKNAPELIRELEAQVSLTTDIFEALKGELEERGDEGVSDWSTTPYSKVLEQAGELMDETETFLEKATTEREDTTKRVRKMKWVLYAEADAKALTEKFHKFNASLSAVQSVDHLHTKHIEANGKACKKRARDPC
ncbi:hypothetical protein EIP86_007511 [Pleurotus ostreatoroseus]|nr:hypothetical protein EIP86_007511 [Pleurotus ostreatoroseus]